MRTVSASEDGVSHYTDGLERCRVNLKGKVIK